MTTTYPPAMSAKGDNAYYLDGCEYAGHVPAYCSCLHKIALVSQRKTLKVPEECLSAITKRVCPAQAMQQQEQLAGVALFYQPRAGLQVAGVPNRVSLSPRAPGRPSEPVRTHKPAPAVHAASAPKAASTNLFDTVDTTGYAAVLKTSMASAAAKPVTIDDLKRLARPGESLAQVAKRLLAEKKGLVSHE